MAWIHQWGDALIPQLCDAGELLEDAVNAGALSEILSNDRIFGINLYEAGIGSLIETMFCEEAAGPGAVRKTLKHYL